MQIRRLLPALAACFALACDTARTDAEIERSVAQRLAAEASLRGYPIEVTSMRGEVELFGHVASLTHRLRAEAVAERVRGVHYVRNHLVVGAPRRRGEPHAIGRPGRPIVNASPSPGSFVPNP